MLAVPISWSSSRLAWSIALAGFAAMFAQVYWRAANGIWQTDDQAHGPIIVAAVAWLFWRQRRAITRAPLLPQAALGWSCLVLGALMYSAGRSQELTIFEFGSQIPVAAGVILLLQGTSGLRAALFPMACIVFTVPLPGLLIDALTGPLKQWISSIAENGLYAAGYPIARQGVVLAVGPYQLLVADACSGVHSMFSLSALGTVFIHLAGRKGVLHNSLMLASMLPIAFASNVVRVVALVLVTYHFGDRAG